MAGIRKELARLTRRRWREVNEFAQEFMRMLASSAILTDIGAASLVPRFVDGTRRQVSFNILSGTNSEIMGPVFITVPRRSVLKVFFSLPFESSQGEFSVYAKVNDTSYTLTGATWETTLLDTTTSHLTQTVTVRVNAGRHRVALFCNATTNTTLLPGGGWFVEAYRADNATVTDQQ